MIEFDGPQVVDGATQQAINEAIAKVATEQGVVVVNVELQIDADQCLTGVIVTTTGSAQDAHNLADAIVELSKQDDCTGVLCRVASVQVQDVLLSTSAAGAAALAFIALLAAIAH